jgi:Ca2+-transporting ATPase
MSDWYAQKISHLLNEFKADLEHGLSSNNANASRQRYGSNEIRLSAEPVLLSFIVKHVLSVPTLILAVAVCVLIYPLNRIQDALVFFAILCFHILWKYIQDAKTRARLKSIQGHVEIAIAVVRDGRVVELSSTEIVPGDLLLLDEGSYIPADARIVHTDGLVVDETPLFGTSMSVTKTAEDISDSGLMPENQRNMVFAGTYVLEGTGRGIVIATGQRLEIHNPKRQVPVQHDLDSEAEIQTGVFYDRFKWAGCILAGLSVLITWSVLQQSGNPVNWSDLWPDLLFLALGFAIASIPEGIVSTSRAILADNAYRLLHKGVAIRSLINLERLSNVTALCVNDLGVFTTEEMMVSHAFVEEKLVEREMWESWLASRRDAPSEEGEELFPVPPADSQIPSGLPLLVLTASKCCVRGQNRQESATEKRINQAIQQIAEQIGFNSEQYDTASSLVYEMIQTPERPYKMLFFETESGELLKLMCGDAKSVLQSCEYVQIRQTSSRMTVNQQELAARIIQYLRDSNVLVIGIAYRNVADPPSLQNMKQNLTFLGLLAFTEMDYTGEKDAVESCIDAGIKTVMITDKDPFAALDLARAFGMVQDKTAVASKAELDQVGDAYDSVADRLLVYSGPSAEQKLNIVQHLKHRGYSVGLWGQSPKDLRSMKAADVSFASAFRASHITHQNAGCLLLKDGFQVIANLLLHTREAYGNLRNSMRWLLSCTTAQLVTLSIGFIIQQLKGWPMPLTLSQIVWVHFLVNLIPVIGLGHSRISGDLKHNRPQKVVPFFAGLYHFDILLRSFVIALMTIISFVMTLQDFPNDPARAQGAACTALIFTQLIASFQCHRNSWESLPQRIVANIPFLLTILVCMALHLLVIYVPAIRQILWGHEFYGIGMLFSEWQWMLTFCVLLLLLPLNLATDSRN